MKKLFVICALGALAAMGGGLLATGCKSSPQLSKDTAQAVIQAYYDHQTPSGITISIDDTGLRQGITDGYWKLTKVYPNQRWADYTLTPEGKKVLKLASGGDVIQWRPDQGGKFSVLVVTLAANPLQIKDIQDPQDETLPGVNAAKSVNYTEAVDFKGVPQPLQDIAHNPGNRLSTHRQADLSYDGMSWTVHGVV
ncbi:MAG TPA: hypothetical protein VMU71_07945 [Terracidiphilus sp.]|nr:hypothetical protein [Terracidiphilus sp.]